MSRYQYTFEHERHSRKGLPHLHIFFDLDQTLISYNGLIRPHANEVIDQLKSDSHDVFIWSGVGVRVEEVRNLGLLEKVNGVYAKPTDRFERGLTELQIPVRPDAVVDDHEEIVNHFGGVVVRPYFWPDDTDIEMHRVYERLTDMARGGEYGR